VREPPLPPGWRMRMDRSTRVAAGGQVVFGGSPLRVLRLSTAGAELVSGWRAGAAVGDGIDERRLARRLLDAGIAHPEPPAAGDPAQLTVVVPVRDRPAELERCLAGIDRRCAIVVVDDGSEDADAIRLVASRAGASIVRLERSRGPAAARNAGLRMSRTPYVAFVDSDCVVGRGFPGRLLDHRGDPALAVAVPRIVALEPNGNGALSSHRHGILDPPDRGALARYEAQRSPLDMGPAEGLVRPGSAIPYAPSAAMVARVAAIGAGFAEDLSMGEDVDLVWRLADAGWRVYYDPAVNVAHDHRTDWRPWFARRVTYNASAAVLARRHRGKVPPLTLTRGGAVFWTTLALGRPAAAAGACGLDVAGLARILHGRVPNPLRVAAGIIARGRLNEGRHVARALTGPWLPFLLAATAARPRAARRIWAGLAAVAVFESAADRLPLGSATVRVADDIARCAGIWLGCARERRIDALLPQIRRS
jgi:mycofactocin glycosyltransferase